MFDKLFKILDKLESGLADKSLKSKTGILKLIESAYIETVALSNVGIGAQMPSGSKSIISRLKKLLQDTYKGLKTGIIEYKELRAIAKDKIGVQHTALKVLFEGSLSEDQKAQIRDTGDGVSLEKVDRFINTLQSHIIADNRAVSPRAQEIVAGVMMRLADKLTKLTPSELKHAETLNLRGMSVDEIDNLTISDLKKGFTDSDAVRKLATSYDRYLTRLPAKLPAAFSAIRFPVVPLFTDWTAHNQPQRLLNVGIRVTPVGDSFMVLEDQYLLVLDSEKLGFGSGFRTGRDGKQKSVNSRGNTRADERSIKIMEILAEINKRSAVQYTVASDKLVANPRNPKLLLLWIVPEKVRRLLEQTLRTTQVDWDIPHNSGSV